MACSVIIFAFRVCSSGQLRDRERERERERERGGGGGGELAVQGVSLVFVLNFLGHLSSYHSSRRAPMLFLMKALLYWELAMACAPCFSRLRWDLRLFFTDPVVLIGIEASRLKMLIAEGSWTSGITRIIMSFSWNVNCQVLNSGLPTGDAHQVKTLGLPERFLKVRNP